MREREGEGEREKVRKDRVSTQLLGLKVETHHTHTLIPKSKHTLTKPRQDTGACVVSLKKGRVEVFMRGQQVKVQESDTNRDNRLKCRNLTQTVGILR